MVDTRERLERQIWSRRMEQSGLPASDTLTGEKGAF